MFPDTHARVQMSMLGVGSNWWRRKLPLGEQLGTFLRFFIIFFFSDRAENKTDVNTNVRARGRDSDAAE